MHQSNVSPGTEKNRQGLHSVAVTMQGVWKCLMEDGRRSHFFVTRWQKCSIISLSFLFLFPSMLVPDNLTYTIRIENIYSLLYGQHFFFYLMVVLHHHHMLS